MKKRKRLIVDKRFQFSFIGVVIFSLFLFLLMVGWTVYSNIWAILLRGAQSPYLLIIKRQADIDIFYKLTILMIVIGIISFFISHKFAGPVHRVKKAMRQLSKGDFSVRVNLRRGDEFEDLVTDFNSMVTKLKGFIIQDREELMRITGKLIEISKETQKKEINQEDKKMISTELSKISNEIEQIRHEFKI
ncbi:MAG: HAMP domain-containing protein [bacterium]